VPEGFEGGVIAQKAIMIRPTVCIVARARSDAEVDHLHKLGVEEEVMGERELANRMIEFLRV
jgi:monovalent cation:H+ antiporter-2, CPA2 family